ncbi:MAG: hypothetical protein MUE76_06875 [Syntrophales bacterium]|jgi:hypothetical protein|nr:hypothetical protein [Syntrophales bacterium]
MSRALIEVDRLRRSVKALTERVAWLSRRPASGGGGSVAWGDVTGKPSTFPPSAHGHAISDITDASAAGQAFLTAADDAAQTALLNTFTSSLKGLAPASGGGTSNFLRADGTWVAPPAGGSTDLTYTAVTRLLESSTGTDVTLPLVGADPGLMSAADKTKLDGIASGANNYVHPNHTGDVTSTGDGATVIANDAVTFAKMQDIPTDSLIGRDTTLTGNPETITVTGGIEFSGAGSIRTSAFTGDVTKAAGDTVTTIAINVVNNNKLADMAANTLKGNATAGIADPADLPVNTNSFVGRLTGNIENLGGTEATTLLDVFTSSLKGLAPASGGGTTNFLRADGTWAAPGGGSDPWSYVALAANSVVSTTALADVTGMSFTALANTAYEVEIFGAFQTAATTTGIGVAFDVPTGAAVSGLTLFPSSNTAVLASQQRADNADIAPTTGVGTANTNFPFWGKYLIIVAGTGGTVQLRQRSEIAGSNTTLVAGSRMKWRAI